MFGQLLYLLGPSGLHAFVLPDLASAKTAAVALKRVFEFCRQCSKDISQAKLLLLVIKSKRAGWHSGNSIDQGAVEFIRPGAMYTFTHGLAGHRPLNDEKLIDI
jgi:hypothetical protein